MQAIWSMEPPDQRYLRLYKVQVPQFEGHAHRAWSRGRLPTTSSRPSGSPATRSTQPGCTARSSAAGRRARRTYKQLVEVADLDTVLGFKGNYMIFPLKEHNALTEFMAAPYVDAAFGAMDPDELSNVSLEELRKYVCCLHDELQPEEFDGMKPELKAWLERLLADPAAQRRRDRHAHRLAVHRAAAVGPSSLLEDFKLKHREWDVYKVQAEVRKLELENIRYAARLLDERMEDPDIEKKIVLAAGAQPVIDVDDP